MAYLDALATVLPVLLLFALGAVLGRTDVLRAPTAEALRRLVLTVTLPAALFLTFLRVDVEARLLLIVVAVFAACVVVFVAGPLLARLVGVSSPVAPHLLAGFEAGMLGYAVFGAVFGTQHLYRFAIVDIGQVVFVFFVLATSLQQRAGGRPPGLGRTAAAFARTPVILAIGAGIGGSILGIGPVLDRLPPTAAGLEALGLLAATTTPLIALVIGSSTRLRRGSLAAPARLVAVRMTLWVTLALAFNAVVIRGVLGLDPLFEAAVLTMAVLPPPFVIPLYLPPGAVAQRDRDEVLNTLSLATIATLVACSVVAVAYAG